MRVGCSYDLWSTKSLEGTNLSRVCWNECIELVAIGKPHDTGCDSIWEQFNAILLIRVCLYDGSNSVIFCMSPLSGHIDQNSEGNRAQRLAFSSMGLSGRKLLLLAMMPPNPYFYQLLCVCLVPQLCSPSSPLPTCCDPELSVLDSGSGAIRSSPMYALCL